MMFLGETLQTKITSAHNRPTGFDYMRLALASMIILFHTVITSYGVNELRSYQHGAWRMVYAMLIPMFFSLSGFLVAGSLERCRTLVSFAGLRLIRIVPALSCEVILSALLLGPMFTTLPLTDYFSHPEFRSYFLNVVGDIHYFLPGVFTTNPYPGTVNGQLWTIPYELLCYVVLGCIAVAGAYRRPSLLTAVVVILHLLSVAAIIIRPRDAAGVTPSSTLVVNFVVGMAFYRFRDKIPHTWVLALAALAMTMGLLSIPNGDRLAAIPVSYLTVFLGVLNPPRHRLLLSGDYSYGLYLYGYPLQQAFASFGPATRSWWLNLLVVLPAAMVIAVASWWSVEKRALDLRSTVLEIEDRFLSLRQWAILRVRRVTAD
jgi:peptidoglycan/LPS O-acetylase OafA/YrhL